MLKLWVHVVLYWDTSFIDDKVNLMSEQAFLKNYFQSSTNMNLTCSSDIMNFKAVSQESRSQNYVCKI